MHRLLFALTLAAMPLLSQAIEEPDHGISPAGVGMQGEPALPGYNAPCKPEFVRRNEIWLAVR